jgi:heptosyltransferase III
MKKTKRILICRPDRIGDVVLATPLIREIRRLYPDAYIAALVSPYTKDLLKYNPHLDNILIDDPKDLSNYLFYDQVKLIRKFKFDTALILLPTERLAWMLFLACIPNRIGVGTKLYQILTFTRSVSRHKYNPLRHEADYCMDLGRKIGVNPLSINPEIFITENEKKDFIRTYLGNNSHVLSQDNTKIIGIHPGSNKSAPNWNIEKYVTLASLLLQDKNNFIFLTGNENELKFVPKFKSLEPNRVINFIGKLSLRDLCTAISFMDVLISASTGPMHIASAIKTPTVSLFCSLTACSPLLWGPLGNKSRVITPPDDFCRMECIDDPHQCDFKESIPIKSVYEKINELLTNNTVNKV